MNFCDSSGWLIANRPLPDDPVDYDLPKLPMIGCTRIRCRYCGALVRSVAGVAMKETGTEIQLVGLDPATSPLFEPDHAVRFYFCECLYHTESGTNALYEPESSMAIRPVGSWACEGHPIVGLPHDFDGADVAANNLDELVDKALHGWLPDRARREDKPRTIWLARLHGRLAGTPHADKIAKLVAASLTHEDPMVRARALHFFTARPGAAAGPARALELLRGDRAAFAGVPDKITKFIGDSTLEHTLWRVAGPLVAGAARELARSEALAAGKGNQALYDVLGAGDTSWLLEHAAEIARATPAQKSNLIDTLQLKLPEGVSGAAAVTAIKS